MVPTVLDFRNMIKTSLGAASVDKPQAVWKKLAKVYGPTFMVDNRVNERVLTVAGVSEYNVVKNWILGGCVGQFVPADSSVAGHGSFVGARKLALYTRLEGRRRRRKRATRGTPSVSAAVQPTVPRAEKQTLTYSRPAAAGLFVPPLQRLRHLQQTAPMMLMRETLMMLSKEVTVPAALRQHIKDTLLACQDEVRALVSA